MSYWRPKLSNCIVWAALTFIERNAEPRPVGSEPYICFRRTRVEGSRAVFHALVGEPCLTTGNIIPVSYAPVAPQRHAWFAPPVVFHGEVHEGDLYRPIEPLPMPRWQVIVSEVLRVLAGLLLMALAAFSVTVYFDAIGSIAGDAAGWLDRFTAMPFGQR